MSLGRNYYFIRSIADLAFWLARLELPALQAASASFTRDAAREMSLRAAWPLRGACTS